MNRQLLVIALTLFVHALLAAPALAQKVCGDGMKMTDGKCQCDLGKIPSRNKKSCVPPHQEGAVITITSASLADTKYHGVAENAFDGKVCVVGSGGSGGLLATGTAGHYFGSLFCDGVVYYFNDVVVKAGGRVARGPTYKKGDVVEIATVSAKDTQSYAFASDGFDGRSCVVEDALFPNGLSGHYFGTLVCDGLSYYFEDVTIAGKGAKKPRPTPSVKLGARFSGRSVSKGSKVQIVEVAPGDMEFKSSDKHVGQTCTVINGDLTSTGDGWLGGEVSCSNGSSVYFYQFAVSLLD